MLKSRINKIAKITVLFWLMKIVATTLGETLGDFIAQTLELGYSKGILITLLFFVLVLIWQLKSTSYRPIIFWLVIIATTTLGTEISDFIDRSLGLGYTYGSLILISLLILTLSYWHHLYRDLKVYPIKEIRKEILFWIAVLLSNSLGTAFGDYLIDVIGLSYLIGALLTSSIILIVIILHYKTNLNKDFLFWIAFVFTRPFGATFGDFLTKPMNKGGLEFGTLTASLVSIFLMSILIISSYKSRLSK